VVAPAQGLTHRQSAAATRAAPIIDGMIRLITVLPDGVTVAEPTLDELDVRQPDRGWQWIDVPDAGEEAIERIGRGFGFDDVAIEETQGDLVFPKMSDLEDHLFLIAHAPGLHEGRITTHELDVFLTPGTLVTFHTQPIPGIELAVQRLLSDRTDTNDPGGVLADILESGAVRSLRLIDGLDDEIEDLEELAIAGNHEVLGRVQDLRRDAIILRRVLAPQRDTIRDLSRAHVHLDTEALRAFDSLYYDYFRIVESLDGARALLSAVLDTYRNTIAERTNQTIKVLTVFSVILLPLSLMAGIYGMNFRSMPFLRQPWGFWLMMAAMGVVGVGLWLLFVGRGIVGPPRVPRVDRAVGRGLAQFIDITTQPVRAIGRRQERDG
jgi:magnesium transporter